MANNSVKTNDQLFHALALIDMYRTAGQGVSIGRRKSLKMAALLCLREAWYRWLEELRNDSDQSDPVARLEDLVDADGHGSHDVSYLINLRSAPDSWLSKLLRLLHMISEEAAGEKASDAETSVINALALVDKTDEFDQFEQVVQAFKSYIADVRAHQTEW